MELVFSVHCVYECLLHDFPVFRFHHSLDQSGKIVQFFTRGMEIQPHREKFLDRISEIARNNPGGVM